VSELWLRPVEFDNFGDAGILEHHSDDVESSLTLFEILARYVETFLGSDQPLIRSAFSSVSAENLAFMI
jgi:hypothetical protein